MASVTKIVGSGEPSTEPLDGWVAVEGSPQMRTWVLHTSADGTMASGIWETDVGSWHATYTEYEFVHLIEGRITITEDGGQPVAVGPGDAFAVEAGFKGVWTVTEPVRKHWCFRLK